MTREEMMMRTTCRHVLAACLLLAGIGAAPVAMAQATKASGDPITIGVIEDRSGGASFYSQESVKGFKLFIEMMNAGEFLYAKRAVGTLPGIMGRPIRALYEDDENNPNLTLVKTRRLLDNGAQIIFFLSGSGSTLQGRVVCSEQKILCMAPTNVSSRIVQPPNNDYVFTVATSAELNSDVFIEAWKRMGFTRIAYVTDNSATAKTVADGYKRSFEKSGLVTAIDEQVETGARDMIAPLLRIRDAKPDVIFDVIQAAPESANLHRTAVKLGIAIPRWGTTTLTAAPKIWELAGDAINGVLVVDNLSPDNPNTLEVKAAYQKRYGAAAPYVFLHSVVWDGLMLTKKAAETSNSLDGTKLRDAVEQIVAFPSSYGQKGYTLTYGHDRHNGSTPAGSVVVQFARHTPSLVWDVYQPK
jgi:branched-chain amino acid transport system substrate-binding protein